MFCMTQTKKTEPKLMSVPSNRKKKVLQETEAEKMPWIR